MHSKIRQEKQEKLGDDYCTKINDISNVSSQIECILFHK